MKSPKRKARSKPKQARVTIDELEKMLNSEEPAYIHINPDGSITAKKRPQKKKPKVKILTMRNDLGGEYGEIT